MAPDIHFKCQLTLSRLSGKKILSPALPEADPGPLFSQKNNTERIRKLSMSGLGTSH